MTLDQADIGHYRLYAIRLEHQCGVPVDVVKHGGFPELGAPNMEIDGDGGRENGTKFRMVQVLTAFDRLLDEFQPRWTCKSSARCRQVKRALLVELTHRRYPQPG